MEYWQELAGWEKLSIIAFGISLCAFFPSIKVRSHGAIKIVFCVFLILAGSWLAPILGFGLAAWGFNSAAYIVFIVVLIIPQFIAWRKNGSSIST